MLSDLLGEHPEHTVHSPLAGDVGRLAGEALNGAFRIDSDEAAPALFHHGGHEGLGHMYILEHAAAELAFVVLHRLFQNRGPLVLDDGIIHHNIRRAAHVLDDGVPHGEHLGQVADIRLNAEGPASHLPNLLGQLLRLGGACVVVKSYVGAASRQGAGHDPSELSSGPGDDSQFSGKI